MTTTTEPKGRTVSSGTLDRLIYHARSTADQKLLVVLSHNKYAGVLEALALNQNTQAPELEAITRRLIKDTNANPKTKHTILLKIYVHKNVDQETMDLIKPKEEKEPFLLRGLARFGGMVSGLLRTEETAQA
jgi:uncharacterized protein (DUF1778 family)